MINKVRYCQSCDSPLEGHFNRKRCPECAALVRKRPIGKLTERQEKKVRRLAGTMKIKDLAKKIGTSDSNLDRWAGQNGVDINWRKYSDGEIAMVCAYYEIHGRVKTQKRFPNHNIRSIVERNYGKFIPRQIKWSKEQTIELVKMAGLISPTAQAKFFNRPNSFEGGIKSVWIKKFGLKQTSIHGMPHWTAKYLVNQNARYIRPLGLSRKKELVQFRRLIIWSEMEKHLKPGVPKFIAHAISQLAEFQRRLFGTDPKLEILKMIKEREIRTG